MVKKIKKEDVEKSSCVLWAHGDNVLSSKSMVSVPYTKDDLRNSLNYHALFCEKVCIMDAPLLNNDSLRELIMYDDYHMLLSNSILVPSPRSSANNFNDLDTYLRETGRYGLLNESITRPYADFLDENTSSVLTTEQKNLSDFMTQNYEATLLDPGFLADTGLSLIKKNLLNYFKKYQKNLDGEEIIRSLFFYFADELIKQKHPKYASRVKLLSSAIWNNIFLNALNIKPAFPHTYSQDILNILTNDSNNLHLQANYVNEDPFQTLYFDSNDLRYLNPNDIILIRETEEAKHYFKQARNAERENNQWKAKEILVDSLESYLPIIKQEIAIGATGKKQKVSGIREKVRLVEWTGLSGGIGFGLTSLGASGDPMAWTIFGGGLIWVLGSKIAGRYYGRKIRAETNLANQQWDTMKRSQGDSRPIINISETRKGKKPPIF